MFKNIYSKIHFYRIVQLLATRKIFILTIDKTRDTNFLNISSISSALYFITLNKIYNTYLLIGVEKP